MYIKSIELSGFRNYQNLSMDFHNEINILYGDNAQGKTNILEAIYLCGTTRSHRGSKDKEIIKLGNEESHVRMVIEKNQINHRVDIHLKRNKAKGIAINRIPIKKSSELVGFTNFVFFSPEDLNIIKGGPGQRRRFIDMELCQLDKVYLYNLSSYNKVVLQRNNLLKQISGNHSLLDTLGVWNMQLIEYASKIIKQRKEFIKQLNEIIYKIHKKLSGDKEELFVIYEPNVELGFLEQKLEKSLERDLITKTTSIGPHRDDICFKIGEIDIRKYGSQGQQRTSALSLKLSEIEIVKQVIGDKPILLLDDVLSELDRNRQNYLLDNISNIQTIITCTGLEEFVNKRMTINQVYKVVEGTVKKENNINFFNHNLGGNI